jgi:ankyrin repeat protein
MNKRTHRRIAALLVLCILLSGLVTVCVLWVRAQQRQYALNRRQIAALVKNDDRQALALIHAGADPNTPYKPTPLPSLWQFGNPWRHRSPEPVNNTSNALFLACGADWGVEDDTDLPDSPLLVQAMLEHGANVNARDGGGLTLLWWAIVAKRWRTVEVLLHHGANANAPDPYGDTPLMRASEDPCPVGIVRLLLAHGANVNATDQQAETALIDAACDQSPEVVSLLLQHGAAVNAQRQDGMTALHFAVDKSKSVRDRANNAIVRQLLAYGADPNLADKDGETPLLLAQSEHRPDLVALLKQYAASASTMP